MDWLAVDAFPEGGAFVVGEGVEEGFAEGGVWVEVLGGFGAGEVGGVVEVGSVGWGAGVSARAVVVVVVVAMVGLVVRWRWGGGAASVGGRARGSGFEAEGFRCWFWCGCGGRSGVGGL